jgi:hypothetical protein
MYYDQHAQNKKYSSIFIIDNSGINCIKYDEDKRKVDVENKFIDEYNFLTNNLTAESLVTIRLADNTENYLPTDADTIDIVTNKNLYAFEKIIDVNDFKNQSNHINITIDGETIDVNKFKISHIAMARIDVNNNIGA